MKFSSVIKAPRANFDHLTHLLLENGFRLCGEEKGLNIKIEEPNGWLQYGHLSLHEQGVLLEAKSNLFTSWDSNYDVLLVLGFALLYGFQKVQFNIADVLEIIVYVLALLIFRGIIMIPLNYYLFLRYLTRLIKKAKGSG